MITIYQLPGKSTSGHLWPAVCVCFSVAVFQPKREDARCCHFFWRNVRIKIFSVSSCLKNAGVFESSRRQ